MNECIDVHNHVVPESFPRYAGRNANVPWPSMADADACHKHVMISGKVYRTVADGSWSVPRRIEDMGGLGAVPLQDTDAAIRELEYCRSLKFAGVEIASHVNGVSIGDARFEPFFAEAEKAGAAIFVHALRPAGQDRIVGAFIEQAVCFPGDIGLACASMITGGIAERHPKLRIAFSHGG